MQLEDIRELIAIKQEGTYWDFKREWYSQEKKSDLLHDIICMANNLENRDAYIIIGVDEERDYKIIDVTNDPNRKNTQKIVDFLRDKKFAGEVRPRVYIQSVKYEIGMIDVIIIKNSNETPFYLAEKYLDVMPNNIYTRVMDTNKEEYLPLQYGCIHECDFQYIVEQNIGYLEVAQYADGWYSCLPFVDVFSLYKKEDIQKDYVEIIHRAMFARSTKRDYLGNWSFIIGNIPAFLQKYEIAVDWGKIYAIFNGFLDLSLIYRVV